MASSFNFTWSPNSSLFESLKYGEFITSRRFTTVKNHVHYTWCLRLYPKGLKIGEIDNNDPQLTCVFISGPKDVVSFNRHLSISEPIKNDQISNLPDQQYTGPQRPVFVSNLPTTESRSPNMPFGWQAPIVPVQVAPVSLRHRMPNYPVPTACVPPPNVDITPYRSSINEAGAVEEQNQQNTFQVDATATETISEGILLRLFSTDTILVQLKIDNHLFDLFFSLPKRIAPITTSPFDRLLVKVLSGEENKRSDFSIIAENHIYATDSNILITRCPFFEQFFDDAGEDWAEKTTNQFSAPFCRKVMDEIFAYIYTDRVNVPEFTNVELVRELVCAADYFQLYELKKHYERPLLTYLIQNTSGIGALAALIFADTYDFKVLKNVSLSMLSEHYDSIEDAVKTQKAAASASKQDFCFGESEDILALWNSLKKSRENHTSLFDELFAFIRQTSVKVADTRNCSASSHPVLL